MATSTVVQGFRFALDPTPAQQRQLRSHVGAARVAFNRVLAEVKSTLDARHWERRLLGGCVTEAQGWSLPALRRRWNLLKHDEYPWWPDVSKEAFNTGLDSLARSLANWSQSRSGKRAGPSVAFPRFRKKGSGPGSVRFTTGAIRVGADRHHVILPRLGRIRTHESTRKLARRIEVGQARIVSATVACRGGRWHVAFTIEVERHVGADAVPAHVGRSVHRVVGVDLGLRTLATVCSADGTVIALEPHPHSMRTAQRPIRRLQRRAARQQRYSKRWQRTQRHIARLHHRAGNVRRDALNKFTTRLAQRHDVIVVEDLNLGGMARRKPGAGKGGRGFNRTLRDGALGEVRRQLTYKCDWYGSRVVVADRWYPSSKTCSGCGARKPSLHLTDRTYTCAACGLVIDRDANAAINLARLGDTANGETRLAGSGPVTGRGANHKSPPNGAGGYETSTPPDTTAVPIRRGPSLRKGRLPDRAHKRSQIR